jgi:hypothetical protein
MENVSLLAKNVGTKDLGFYFFERAGRGATTTTTEDG